MERNFGDLVNYIFNRNPQKIEGPEKSTSQPVPIVTQETIQQPLISRLDTKTSERSSVIAAAMRRLGYGRTDSASKT